MLEPQKTCRAGVSNRLGSISLKAHMPGSSALAGKQRLHRTEGVESLPSSKLKMSKMIVSLQFFFFCKVLRGNWRTDINTHGKTIQGDRSKSLSE